MRTADERALAMDNWIKARAFLPVFGEVKVFVDRLLEELARSHEESDIYELYEQQQEQHRAVRLQKTL